MTAPEFACITCGPITADDIYLLNWESPHGDERCHRCGGGDLAIPNPDDPCEVCGPNGCAGHTGKPEAGPSRRHCPDECGGEFCSCLCHRPAASTSEVTP